MNLISAIESNPWVFGIVISLLAAAIWAVLIRFTKWGAASWRWVRKWRLTREPRVPAVLPWVAPPRWELRRRDERIQGHVVYGVQNVGGEARRVRIDAEDPDTTLTGALDSEVVPPREYRAFAITRSPMGGLGSTRIVVQCSDANDVPQEPTTLSIRGVLDV